MIKHKQINCFLGAELWARLLFYHKIGATLEHDLLVHFSDKLGFLLKVGINANES